MGAWAKAVLAASSDAAASRAREWRMSGSWQNLFRRDWREDNGLAIGWLPPFVEKPKSAKCGAIANPRQLTVAGAER